jgi:hypothetical protein
MTQSLSSSEQTIPIVDAVRLPLHLCSGNIQTFPYETDPPLDQVVPSNARRWRHYLIDFEGTSPATVVPMGVVMQHLDHGTVNESGHSISAHVVTVGEVVESSNESNLSNEVIHSTEI